MIFSSPYCAKICTDPLLPFYPRTACICNVDECAWSRQKAAGASKTLTKSFHVVVEVLAVNQLPSGTECVNHGETGTCGQR